MVHFGVNMKKSNLISFVLSSSLLLTATESLAINKFQCGAFYGGKEMKLVEFEGQPFFRTMTKIRHQMDNASVMPFEIPSSAIIMERAKEFHPDAYHKILKLMLPRNEASQVRRSPSVKAKAEAKLIELVDALAGKKVSAITIGEVDSTDKTPHITNVIFSAMKSLKIQSNILAAMNLSTFLTIASGAGSKVYINDKNKFINVGYELDGMDRAEKSGRSSSTSPFSGFNDASDTFLLTALHKMVATSARGSSGFYKAMMQVLVKSSAQGYEKLTPEEQGSLTDFTAVYAAEMRRSMMSGLKQHRWMDDLAEVYFISGYGSKAGKVIGEQGFADGEAKTYFAVGSNGSGIGVMRKYRRYLQKQVTATVRELNPGLIENVEAVIGPVSPRSDVFHDVMIFLNDPRKQDVVVKKGDQLINAVTELMEFIETKHALITPAMEHITKDDPEIKKYNAELERKRQRKADQDAGKIPRPR
jgi:hypothetical protein